MNLNRWLIHTITYRVPTTARDANGDISAQGAKTTARARVQRKDQMVYDFDGEEKRSTHTIYLAEDIGAEAVIWVDGSDDDDAKRPLTYGYSEQLKGGAILYKVTV
jgi:hypothetical protein